MSARNYLGVSRRSLLGGYILLWLAGCASQADLDQTILDAVKKEAQIRDRSPKTTVWLHNRTGEVIREVSMRCKSVEAAGKSRSLGTSWSREMNIGEEPEEIWSERFPDPLVLVTLKVRFEKGAQCEYQLNHTCQPGDKMVLVIERGGRVSVKMKE